MAAIKVAKNYCPIKDQETNIINLAHTPVLFHNDCLWSKTNNTEFNIAMSTYDSSEAYNIVGIQLLRRLRFMFDIKDTGLYRDDGEILLRKTSPRNKDGLRKIIIFLRIMILTLPPSPIQK